MSNTETAPTPIAPASEPRRIRRVVASETRRIPVEEPLTVGDRSEPGGSKDGFGIGLDLAFQLVEQVSGELLVVRNILPEPSQRSVFVGRAGPARCSSVILCASTRPTRRSKVSRIWARISWRRTGRSEPRPTSSINVSPCASRQRSTDA